MPKDRRAARDAAAKSRRHFLKTGATAVAGAAALSMPRVANAQEAVVFKFQSTWPSKDISTNMRKTM